MNHFPELEEAAEAALARGEARRRTTSTAGLVRYLRARHGSTVRVVRVSDERKAMRRYDPERRVLVALRGAAAAQPRASSSRIRSASSRSRPLLDATRGATQLTTPRVARARRVALANYFAGAVLMPYEPFLEAARAERYDIELLGHRFRASFEQVCHRLTTLRRPGPRACRST